MTISIHYPRMGTHVKSAFVAFGTAMSAPREHLIGVVGTLTDADGRVAGETILFRSQKRAGGRKHCWAIMFKNMAAGLYTLQIKCAHTDGSLTAAEQVLNIRVGVAALDAISSDHPTNGTPLSADEKEYFIASGVTSSLATKAFFTKQPFNSAADYVVADYVDTSPNDQIWWATFPPLAAGNYIFTVEDTDPDSKTYINITVPQ